MNREQYLAKRMWFHGPAVDVSRFAAIRHPHDVGSDACVLPATSLADHYQRFHQHHELGRKPEDKAN